MIPANGILLVDKPAGISSAGALRKLEKKFKLAKIGHGGTLDPFATGLLVVFLGDATKIARFLLSGNKTYLAEAKLGFATTTGDKEGEPLGTITLPAPDHATWEKTRGQFLGKIHQVPPQYSAIKKNGRRLYSYARAQEEVKIDPREVEVHNLQIERCDPTTLHFQVTCSGGTYIRVLAEDWARAAGSAAHLENLRRTHSGIFSLDQAHSLDNLLEPECTSLPTLISIPEALTHLPQILCTPPVADKIRHGNQEILADFLQRELIATKTNSADYILLLQRAETAAKPSPLALLARNTPSADFKLERVFQ